MILPLLAFRPRVFGLLGHEANLVRLESEYFKIVVAASLREAERITLEVRASNRGAQSLYSRFGFAPAGVRKGYYADTGEDAIVMWAHDIDDEAYAQRLRRLWDEVPGPTLVEHPR